MRIKLSETIGKTVAVVLEPNDIDDETRFIGFTDGTYVIIGAAWYSDYATLYDDGVEEYPVVWDAENKTFYKV